jgi:hypothetical protein
MQNPTKWGQTPFNFSCYGLLKRPINTIKRSLDTEHYFFAINVFHAGLRL